MQRQVQQITEGIVEYQKGYLEFSCQRIEISVVPNDIFEGTLSVKTSDGTSAEGEIISSDYRLQCKIEQLSGEELEIPYSFDAQGLESGQKVNGNLVFICNLGEYRLPFTVHIEQEQLQSSMGNIKNLFHFTNLAKTDWAEAVELFYSPDFVKLFQFSDKQFLPAYLGFSKNPGNEANMEEFLIEVNKKTAVRYMIEEEMIHITDAENIQEFEVTVSKNGWGYTSLFVDTIGDYLVGDKMHIESSDFEGNVARIFFRIDTSKLHAGTNPAKIIIYSANVHLELPVIVERLSSSIKRQKIVQEKKCILELMSVYEEFRLKKFSRDTWLRHTRRIVNRWKDLDENKLLPQLVHAHVLLEEERYHESEWLLEQLKADISEQKTEPLLNGYYFYLTTFFRQEEAYIRQVSEELRNISAQNPSNWEIGWMLMNLEEELQENSQAKLDYLEKQFQQGCYSPVVYLEALQLLIKEPVLLRKIEEFEEQVLWYAVKNQVLTIELVDQIQYVAERKKNYSERLYKILVAAYEKWGDSQTLTALCDYLIKGNRVGSQYFEWYALAVEKNLRVTRLYDYYMMSMDLQYRGKIPKMVLMYFSYQADLDYEHTAFLYTYICKHRQEYPEIYRSYCKHIEEFVLEQIGLGRINQDLAYLYQEVVTPELAQSELAYTLAPLVFMNLIRVDNDSITHVILIQNKVLGESIYPLENKRTYLPIYGRDYKILLQDAEGNRYTQSIGYHQEAMMKPEKLMDCISPYIEDRIGINLYLCEANKNYVSVDAQNVKRFQFLAESEQIEQWYKKEIRTKLLHYYYDNDMISELDSYLEEIEPVHMDIEERAEFVKFLISRGMFEKAYDWALRYGLERVKVKSLARLISKCIMSNAYGYDTFLLTEAFHIFHCNKYDENILTYLMQHYRGTIQELRDIWKAAKALEMDVFSIMEHMLKQMLFARSFVGEKADIFMDYQKHEAHDERLVYAFMTYSAYEYFVYDSLIDERMLETMIARFMKEEKINVPCKLCMIKYFAKNPDTFENVARMIAPKLVNQFTRDEVYFPFYKDLIPYVPELESFLDKQFVEYKAEKGVQVLIRYVFENKDGESEYLTEEMKDMYEGIHVKVFKLFAGERVQYYIIEKEKNREEIVSSETIQNDDTMDGKRISRYHMINDMILGIQHADYHMVNTLIAEYEEKEYLVNELFTISG